VGLNETWHQNFVGEAVIDCVFAPSRQLLNRADTEDPGSLNRNGFRRRMGPVHGVDDAGRIYHGADVRIA